MSTVLRLIGSIWLTWLLWISSRVSCWVAGWLAHKSILWHILHLLSMMWVTNNLIDVVSILSLHLNLLKLFLDFHLLLLRRKMLPTVTHATRIMELLRTTSVILYEMIVIRIWILPWEKSGLTCAFTILFDSLLWSRTLTFCKML